MKSIPIILVVLMLLALVTSCEKENMDTFGRYYIYMSKDTSLVKLKDTLSVVSGDTLQRDSTLKVIGINRSGISSDYPAINVKLKVDSAYMDSMLTVFNNPLIPNTQKSSAVLYFKNTVILPADCYTISRDITIANGERIGVVPVRLKLKNVARLNKNSSYVLPISLVSSSSDTINWAKKRTMLRLSTEFNFKTVNP